jgi:proton-dependent oligopeptide transporter, POT family
MNHPRGIYTLFFTEMWERFSYYGMRALLMLFMVDAARGGMGLTKENAGAIYGLYTGLVYLTALPGGWLGDRLLGARRAVWWGGVVIALGHIVLGLQHGPLFYVGLLIVALGSGLLKSNMSSLVGQLYPEGGARRDAGYTLFYMGVNTGAFLGPLICGLLAEKVGWAWGFSAAAVGMGLGLLQFRFSEHHLLEVGQPPTIAELERIKCWRWVWLFTLFLAAVGTLACLDVLHLDARVLTKWTVRLTLLLAAGFFLRALVSPKLLKEQKLRVGMIMVIFIASVLFWAGFEQIGSCFALIAQDYTERVVGGWEVPASWLQSVNPVFVISLAPFIAMLWQWLAARKIAPSLPQKLAWAMALLAVGFIIAALSMKVVVAHGKDGPWALVLTVFFLTVAELCISPVSLSAVSKLAPPHLVSQFMGIIFLGSSVGNILAGERGGEVAAQGPAALAEHFMQVVYLSGALGLGLLVLTPVLKKLQAGVQ